MDSTSGVKVSDQGAPQLWSAYNDLSHVLRLRSYQEALHLRGLPIAAVLQSVIYQIAQSSVQE